MPIDPPPLGLVTSEHTERSNHSAALHWRLSDIVTLLPSHQGLRSMGNCSYRHRKFTLALGLLLQLLLQLLLLGMHLGDDSAEDDA